MSAGNPIQDVAGRRLLVAGALALCGWGAVVVRLLDVQGIRSAHWTAEGLRQQERAVRLQPERGSFLDRDGRPIAASASAWSAWADPTLVGGPAERDRAASALARVLDTPESVLRARLRDGREFAWLQRTLPPERRDAVAALGLRGVAFARESRRIQPNGALAGDLIGFVGVDGQGLEGLEHALEDEVAGRPGLLLTSRDARGDDVLPGGVTHVEAQRGADVVLTLDAVVQHVAQRELEAAVARTGAKAGTIVVTFPLTGEIAALSNHPLHTSANDPAHPSHLRTNRALASCYEPGSTLKMFTAAAALEHGVRPTDVFDCEMGSVRVGRARLRDHRPFGRLTVGEILAHSSNVGAVKLGRTAGAADLHRTLERFGFGRRTGVGFPGESAGILRDPSAWTPLSLATVSFGQEIAVTPLQLALAAGAIACDGVLAPPRLVREIRRADGTVVVPPAPRAVRATSPGVARSVARMLEGVVEDGTGTAARVPGYRVAGKTGTAQKIGPDGTYLEDAHVASFVGWAPARAPAVLVLVVLDEPRGPAFHGGDVAAPVFAAVAWDVLRHLRVPPDDPGRLLGVDDPHATAEAAALADGAAGHA